MLSLRRYWPVVLLVIAPILVSWPALVGFSADPIYLTSGLLTGGRAGWLPGLLNLDLNVGVTTQALGHLAAEQWLRGEVPWWNSYSGIGMPLAGEMQASALLLPFVLLLHFQNGPFILKLAMQVTAGLSCYALMRELGLSRLAAFTGGLMFAISGTYAWLGHGPIMPVAFLPLFLLGIERARDGGYRLIAIALAFSLYAGFPETAYLDGLFALLWTGWRLGCTPQCWRFAGRVILGGILGIVLAAPALWSFAQMLINSSVENHAVMVSVFDPVPEAMPKSVPAAWLFPYIFGPLLAYPDPAGVLADMVQCLGGYFSLLALLLALLGLWGQRQRWLRWVLLIWIVLCVGTVANVPGITQFIYALPMTRQTILVRYLNPSWQLAATILACLALDDWRRGELGHGARIATSVLLAVIAVTCVVLAWPLIQSIGVQAPGYWNWPAASLLWAAASVGAGLWLLSQVATPKRMVLLLALLVVDAAAMFEVPMFAGPRDATIDTAAIDFLKAHTGLQRFYSLGPYRPNYGAFFETAQLNHEYLPIPANWVAYVRGSLDPSAHPIMFRGDEPVLPPGVPTHAQQMVRHLGNFEALGVRYVVAHSGINPFVPEFSTTESAEHGTAHNLAPGAALSGVVDAAQVPGGEIDGIGVAIGTYMGSSDGHLSAELCADAACAYGTLDLAQASDNAIALVQTAPVLTLAKGQSLRWRIWHEGGTRGVAIWLPPGGASPRLYFTLHPEQQPPPRVYRDQVMEIYELAGAAPYFQTLGGPCLLDIKDRTALTATCDSPATLVRRELSFPGWRASVGDADADITPYGEIMQQIALPVGTSSIRFRFAPPYAGLCWAMVAAGLLGLLPYRRRRI